MPEAESMRLTPGEIAVIKETSARHFGATAGVWLFGSRVDDEKRGGDIDLLVDTDLSDADADATVRARRIAFLADLKQRPGERKVDLLVDFPSRSARPPVFRIAREQGIQP